MGEAGQVRKASGCLYGMALGDALAAPTEFLGVGDILRRFPPSGPQEPMGRPARVTDDTQMALAVGEALNVAPRPYTSATLEEPLRHAFVEWYRSPDNDRAPGNTCLRACEGLARRLPWYEATVGASKGCGANMRVAPVGVLPLPHDEDGRRTRAALAQFQAALTHGHPTALAASDLTATAIADLVADGNPETLTPRLRQYAEDQRSVYHEDWLGPLWQRPAIESVESFIARGWDECVDILDRLESALDGRDRETDPSLQTGAGWIAEEAFATGLLCFLLFPTDGVAAIRRAAVTSGDSDSIACLAGAFAGARLGIRAWPEEWVQRIEYRDRLGRLGRLWD